jgi:hypothetical protein
VRSIMIYNDLYRMFMNVLAVETDETKFTWNDSFRGSVVPPRHRGQGASRLLCFTTTWMFSAQSVRNMDPNGSKWIQRRKMSEVCLGYLEFQAGDAADSSRAWYTRARGGVQGW